MEWPRPILCYVTQSSALPAPQIPALLECVKRAVAAGISWVQLREKELSGAQLFALSQSAAQIAQGSATRIVVNDRADIALTAGAHGVHLGGKSVPVRELAEWARPMAAARSSPFAESRFLVGRSCHSLEEALQAERDSADYVFFGPVFATPSKMAFGPPQGLDRLAAVCSALHIPVLAIGGVTAENAGECARAGAAGVAAIRAFQDAASLEELRGTCAAIRQQFVLDNSAGPRQS